jgi:hypothetical protein
MSAGTGTSAHSIRSLAEWTLASEPPYRSPLVLRHARLLLLDTLGCAITGARATHRPERACTRRHPRWQSRVYADRSARLGRRELMRSRGSHDGRSPDAVDARSACALSCRHPLCHA